MMDYERQRKLGLRIFKGEKYTELRKAIVDGKCFQDLLPLAEIAGAIEHWDKFIDEWKYHAGIYWSCITDEMRIKEFPKLDDEWKYYAYMDWSCITDEIRIEEFSKLHGEWKYNASKYWSGITEEMKEQRRKRWTMKGRES